MTEMGKEKLVRVPSTYWLPLSHKPKIQLVREEICRQTIRAGWRKRTGDRVGLFTWSAKPYRSPWGERFGPRGLVDVINIVAFEHSWTMTRRGMLGVAGVHWVEGGGQTWLWASETSDDIAHLDGVGEGDEHPGLVLRDVLKAMAAGSRKKGAGEWETGVMMQILRW